MNPVGVLVLNAQYYEIYYLPASVQRPVPAATGDGRQLSAAAVSGAYHELTVMVLGQLVGRAPPVTAAGRGRLLVQPFQLPDEMRLELVGGAERGAAHGATARGRRGRLLLLAARRRSLLDVVVVVVVIVGV